MKKVKTITDSNGINITEKFLSTINNKFWAETLPRELLIYAISATMKFFFFYLLAVWALGLPSQVVVTVVILANLVNAPSVVKDSWGEAFFQTMLVYAPCGVILYDSIQTEVKEEHD